MRTIPTSVLSRLTAAAIAAALVTSVVSDARACGGFFCQSSPVDQTAEHILFTINPDVTITTYVQISYTGDKDGFAWLVPVPGNPKLAADFPALAFSSLDQATQPQYTKNFCYRYAEAPTLSGGADAGVSVDNGVTVIAHQVVGPYETTTLEGTSPDVIVKWLQDHQYRITDKMIPVLAPYVADGLHFVALRLTADATVSDIKPLTMTYPGQQPMIPIRLTAIAAQPEMGIVAWVLGKQRYAPDNYKDLKIPDSLIEFNQYGYQSNYLTVVSREADKVGGEAFVTEYAKPTTELHDLMQNQGLPPPSVSPDAAPARDALVALLGQFPYITRFYTRISAEEMLDDPRFTIAADQSDVSNIHDLTEPGFDYSQCGATDPPPPDPCAFNYCGRRGACQPTTASLTPAATGAVVVPVPACVCAGDATARPTNTAYGQPAMYCEPIAMNFDVATAGAATVPACEGFDCGPHGECVGMNGNPTCRCDAGYGASVQVKYDQTTGTQQTVVTCEAVSHPLALPRLPKPGETTFTPVAESDSGSCSVGRSSAARTPGGALAALVGLGAGAAVRRRRSKARRR